MSFILNNPFLLGIGLLSLLDLALLLILFFEFRRYRKRQEALLAGETVANLEGLVLKHKNTLANHQKNLKELGAILEELVKSNKLNVRKVGLIRFNPFADAGGNMSFALALLDGKDNGIVISSLHSREGTRIYAKNIEHGKSKYHLTDEEQEAIEEANHHDN